MIAHPCSRCSGQGMVEDEKQVSVEIPAGVNDGANLRLVGEGEAGPRGVPPGDLYVQLGIRPHPSFARQGDDLLHDLDIGIAAAALGTEADVPLLEGGTDRVKVPAGTQHGEIIRLRGKGAQRLRRRGRGSLLVRVSVDVPAKLSRTQRKILRRYAESRGEFVL